jgi:hypothetical protein
MPIFNGRLIVIMANKARIVKGSAQQKYSSVFGVSLVD